MTNWGNPNPQTLAPVVLSSGTLASGTSQDVVMTSAYDMSGNGTYIFTASTAVTGDGNVTNDAMSPAARNVTAITALPYTQNFDASTSAPVGWTTTGWTIGTTHANPVSGNGIFKNMYLSASSGQFSMIELMNATANTELAFDYRIVDYTNYPATPTANPWGNIQIQASTNCGSTFATVGTIDPSNHISSSNWARKTYSLGAYAGSSVIVRLVATWIVGDYYIDVAFHPDSIRDNPNIPPIVLTDFKIGNKSVSLRHPNSPLKQTIWTAKEITLDYKDNMMSFDFAALDYTNPAKNRYAYMMEGFDKDWIYSGTRRTATYTNLDPGDYVFRVKGSNNDDVWNETGTLLKVTILPPWYRTWWAYSFYGILAFAGLFTYRRYDLKQIQLKNKSEFAEAEARNLKEVDEMKSRFFANISHEFRTPLTLIDGPAKQMAEGKGNPDEHYSIISRNTRRLLSLVNQLLDLSKFDAGKMELQLEQLDIAALVREVASSFDSLSAAKGIEYDVNVAHQPLVGMFDRDKVEKILSNLLSNAFKFTPNGGDVQVRLSNVEPQTSNLLALSVSDSGIGIAANKLDKIFDRFYQVNDQSTRDYEGTGIGLALTKEFVEHHGGTITVESEEGKGTTFTVQLPLKKVPLRTEEIVMTASRTVLSLRATEGSEAISHANEIARLPDGQASSLENTPANEPSSLRLLLLA